MRTIPFFTLAAALTQLSFAEINIATESLQGPDMVNNGIRLGFLDDVTQFDLIEAGQQSFSSLTSTPTFGLAGNPQTHEFLANNINDGVYQAGSSNNAFWDPGLLPATMTIDLNTTIAPDGYNLTSIASFFGWGLQSATQANQVYDVFVSVVGSADYTLLTSVNYTPFTGGLTDREVDGAYESKVVITEDSAAPLASGVDSIRFVIKDPGEPESNDYVVGSVIREIDVTGFAVGADPSALQILSPETRQVIQRDLSNNRGEIPISGTFVAAPDRIEARAVVRNGIDDSGTTTDWQLIEDAPTGGTFSGSLSNVTAGGWYDIEIRTVTGGANGMPAVIERVGVGDIYITAGQSNSANAGFPAITPQSDRVSALDTSVGADPLDLWVVAADPQPGAEGTGGSVWSRLGDLLEDRENVPVAFVSIGRLNSKVADWSPGNSFYMNLLRPTVERFPENGFRALLWHQGEADSAIPTSANSYQGTIAQVIQDSRTAAGWDFPFYIAEASFLPSSTLTVIEGVMAGQRGAAFNLEGVFLGSDTNGFHLEGRSSDGTHFNTPGLLEHARQWADILTGQTTITPVNGDFEKNTGDLTEFAPLADNGFTEVIPSSTDQETLLDWSILAPGGTNSADGVNGYFNPGPDTYSRASGSSELANLSGQHVATLRGGTTGNHLLQTLRAFTEPDQTYLLTVAVGLRDVGSNDFGGARIELLNGRNLLGQRLVDLNTLNAAAGGSAAGKFTNITVRVDTGTISGQPHELGIRISKAIGGGNTYLDVDNVRLVKLSTSSPFVTWLDENNLDASPNEDSDGDGIRNLVEFALGTSPTSVDQDTLLKTVESTGGFRVTRRIGSEAGLSYAMETSSDLVNWTDVSNLNTVVLSSAGGFEVVDLRRTNGWFRTSGEEYLRFKVTVAE